ncbi:MAG: hypothetical protein KDA32_01055 [Phycisphaerales bacterium]|nr:hypothetical protein [Phycisphaerales bacterium]
MRDQNTPNPVLPDPTRPRRLHWLAYVVMSLAFVEGAWLAFDGVHALTTGDYVTPASGRFAGQLGPWSKVVAAVGIPPRSTAMKLIHVALGAAWLVSIAMFGFRARSGWGAMLACAIAGLWYLPFGTLIGVILIALLCLPRVRT